MVQFKERISKLETEMKKKCDKEEVKKIVKEELGEPKYDQTKKGAQGKAIVTTVTEEINDRKSRENNIVVYGAAESASQYSPTLQKHAI